MSRVAKNPVKIPSGVEVKLDAAEVIVKGPLGALQIPQCADVEIKLANDQLE